MMPVIELAGLPGCGKSTLWKHLKAELQRKGRNVFTYSELMCREPLFVNRGIFFQLLKWHPGTVFCMKRIEKYCATVPGDGKREYFKKEFTELYYRIHVAAAKRGEDIILLDEGMIQNFTSLFFTDTIPRELPMEKTVRNIVSVKGSFCVVKCNISVEESMARLQKRARENDRYRRLEKDALREALLVKEQNIDYVLSFVKPDQKMGVAMENTAENCAKMIIREIGL